MKNGIINGIITTLLVITATVFISCGGLSDSINVTDGYGGVLLSVQGTAPASSTVLSTMRAAGDPVTLSVTDNGGTEIGVLTVTDARLVLDEIEFEQDDSEIDSPIEEAQELEIEFEGPFVVDLLKGTVNPPVPYTELLPGTYTEIELKLEKIEADDWADDGVALLELTDPLYGNSIYIEGTYTGTTSAGAATNMPFSLSFNLDEEFETEIGSMSEGIIIDEGVVNTIIIAFRTTKWFQFDNIETNPDSVDFADLVPAGGTAIVLDETALTNNAKIWETIKENIKMSADYGEDEDQSGHLESDEDEDPDSEDGDDD